ncbi:unnamed protein product (macronuclear) [Paramecium tetraurelia]|uniref:Protein kinase domain-containing protein n=1 Tax=Paramecium tetraurelia TaxID=5888 RepID=A0D5T1_PARTE|nr:uncharacterized protein GSPATT00013828001 [Paramecium tetraurelia]CAK78398.1 unnamed protein product [Paramecium tetraurelia]|eukprot:XP_001445795.1 hypothetical protein (macronuclear) [Paramecium tetraurelia strain d4-2]
MKIIPHIYLLKHVRIHHIYLIQNIYQFETKFKQSANKLLYYLPHFIQLQIVEQEIEAINNVFPNKYTNPEFIGAGAFSQVFKCKTNNNEFVAIKIIGLEKIQKEVIPYMKNEIVLLSRNRIIIIQFNQLRLLKFNKH